MFDLTIQGKLFVIVPVILIFVGLLFNYRKITRSRKNKLYSIAWILRLLVILITIFILADPFFHFTNTYETKPDVSIFIDTSSSMAHNTEDLVPSVSEKLNELASWIDPKTDKLSIFEFNSSITPITNVNNIHFDHSLTDFSQIPGMIKSSGTAISFLITDGIATSGPDPSAIKLNSSQTIHVIAAENKTALKELSIDKTEYPQTAIEGDTITVKAIIGIQSTEDIRTEVQILDKSGNTIANIPVEATPGEGIREISLPVAIQNNQIPDIVSIITVPGEKNTLNNTFKLNLNILSENEHILFVTGALSPNTSMIKEISSSVPRAVVDHFFRLGGTTWNRPNNEFLSMKPKLIVLDNFPVMNEDRALYNGLIQYAKSNGIPIVFFEGANSDLLTSSLIGQTANLQAEPVQITSPQTISLTNPGKRYFDRYLTESLPPVKTINQWKSNSLHTDLLTYTDDSVALTKIDMDFKFVGVFIPDLSKLNFKLQRTNSPDFIRNGIRNILLSLIYSENELIASRLEKSSYDLGEMVNIVGTYNDDYVDKPDRMVFTLLDDSGEVVQEIPAEFDVDSREYKGNFLVDKSGSLKIISKSFWNNGNEYNSAPVEFVVQNVIVEDRDLQTNRKALLELSSNNNGQFFMLDDLLKMYNTMEFASERKVKSYQLSTISTHKWWWLIIILLSAEWFIRKRIGLL